MKFLIPRILSLVLFFSSGFLFAQENTTTLRPDISFQSDSTDVLEAALLTQRQYAAPSTNFRAGHIQPLEIKDFRTMSAQGYAVQLPTEGLIPSPTIAKGVAYVSGGFGSKAFYAFEAMTGKTLWAVELDDDGPSSAVVVDDIVVFNTESCTIFALEAPTGKMRWSHWLGDPLMSMPAIAHGKVFTAYPAQPREGREASGQSVQTPPLLHSQPTKEKSPSVRRPTHVMIAFDLQTGSVLWQKWIDGDIMSAPVIEGEEVFITTFSGTLYTFHQGSGEILAAQAVRGTSAPVVVDRAVYLSQRSDQQGQGVQEALSQFTRGNMSKGRQAYAKPAPYLDKDVQSRSELKSQADGFDEGNGFGSGAPESAGGLFAAANIGQSNVSSLQAFQGSRILHLEGRNYSTMGDELICTRASDDKLLWQESLPGDIQQAGGFLATPPLEVGGKILIATLAGDVLLFHAKNGKRLAQYKVGEPIRYQPVVESGNIYLTTMSGKMHCIATGDSQLTGWPVWGANAAPSNQRKP
ncbi:MAG: PQQ-binding-like beta-propeller repeat protein [Bacteroidota bacterium]